MREGDALRYHLEVDLSQRNTSHTQMLLLTGRNKRVLEVGPATGYMTEALRQRGCRVTGLEKDPVAAERAAQFCERIIVGDVQQIDFESAFGEERFDVVMFGDVLEHLEDPEGVLARASCLLAPRGYVVASVPNVAHGSIRLALLAGQFRYTELGLLDRTHLRFFTREGLERLFREAGYRVGVWRRVTVDPFQTEVQVREADYPEQLVASLREDAEALTYQFVVKAHPRAPAKGRSRARSRGGGASEQQGSRVLGALRQMEKEIAERDAALAQRDAALAEKDAALAEKESLLAQQGEALLQASDHLIAIRQSLGYRVLEGYRRWIRWLFPPDSWRGLPYRALRRGVRWLLDFRNHQRFLIQRPVRAQQRYGTRAVLAKSIDRLTARVGNHVDPIEYALSVDWRVQRPPELILRQPLNLESLTINWVIPTLGEGGGHRTIFRFVEHLANHGHRQRIYEMPVAGPQRSSREELRGLIRRFYDLDISDVFQGCEEMAPADITLATSWHTAYPVARFAEARRKFYFVQDFEPFFAPVGTESVLAENTYRFGFHGITAGRWLAEKLAQEFGMECDYFNLAVDTQVYFPKDVGGRKKIFFYARPATPRRGFELGIKALQIFHSRHPDFEIVLAGGNRAGKDLPFPVTDVGYVSEQRLNDLYNQSAAALVVSLTNCSLLPLEIMATGCPVVTTIGENNEKVLPPDSAIFAAPSPHHLAEAIAKAVRNPPPREKLIATACRFRWNDEMPKVEAILRRCVQEAA